MLNFYIDQPLLIDDEFKKTTKNWYSTDTMINFVNQPRKFKEQYRDQIVYKFNSLGYRTKEINELDKNFLLTFGCSYTEGVGLPEEKIWNYNISKFLNLDLYNCAKQASGIDVQYYNATLWKNSNLPIPKIVIVQWPHKARKQFGFADDNKIRLSDMSETPTPDGVWWAKRYIVNTGEMNFNNFIWYENFNNIWESLNVPVLNFTWDDDLEENLHKSKFKLWKISPNNYDKARDNGHDGPLFHNDTAELLTEILKQSNFTYKI